jgi:DNA gyrase subunit A
MADDDQINERPDDPAPDDPAPSGADGRDSDDVPEPEASESGLSVDETIEAISMGGVEPIEIEREMEQSFLDYAMSVLVARALPDARDGLKPVHRRILWGMFEQNVLPNRSHVKCARVVGDVMGKYHPHGDQSIYDALVRLGQTFSMRHPLIDPHGNFGSPSDQPAAMRYTECRLSRIAMHMLDGIDEETVDFNPNFDGNEHEPDVLPARFPNLLVNGGQGIAVGMATNIPPHNLGEVIDAVQHLLAHPDATVEDLMDFVKGPDFPTGCQILGRAGSVDAYRTGRGSVKMRAVAEIEETSSGTRIVVSAIPYQTSVEAIEQKAADAVERREIDGIRAIVNESAKGVTRLVFQLKRDATPQVVLNNLYKHTPMQTSFGVNMVALVDDVPRTLNLRDALVAYVDHQIEVITRRSQYRLDEARRHLHRVEGLIKALDMIDQIIVTIRASENRPAARDALMATPFEFSEVQANHILDMTLGRLTRLGRAELEDELAKLREQIIELEAILADDARLRGVIRDELAQVRDTFANDRRSELTFDPGDLDIEDLIDDEDVVVTLSNAGYIKNVAIDAFRTQGRGGRGVAGTKLKDDDFVSHVLHTTAHSYLLFFSNLGRVYRLKAHEIPLMDRTARGTAIVNLLPLQPGEHIQALIDTRDYETNRFLFFATKLGQVKKTRFTDYDSSLRAGIIALNLRDGDELVSVFPTNGDADVLMTSKLGQTIRFTEDAVRSMGRAAAGVRGMRLRAGDELVAADAVRDGANYVIVTDAGYGKRTATDQYPRKGRGTQGVRGISLPEARGQVVSAFLAADDDQMVVVSTDGILIRTIVGDVSMQGRSATGVRVMNLEAGARVASVAPITASDVDPDEPTDPVAAEVAADGGADAPVDTDQG